MTTKAKAQTAKARASKPRVAKPRAKKSTVKRSETQIRSKPFSAPRRSTSKRAKTSVGNVSVSGLSDPQYRSYVASTLRAAEGSGQSIFVNETTPVMIGWMNGVHGGIVQAEIISQPPVVPPTQQESTLDETSEQAEVSPKAQTAKATELENVVPIRAMGFFVCDDEVTEWLAKQ